MKPTLPGRAMAPANVALRPVQRAHHAQAVRADDAHPAAPRLLRAPAAPARRPPAPVSLKPAEMTIAPFTPASTHSPIDAGHGRRRRDDDGQVDRVGHGGDASGRP